MLDRLVESCLVQVLADGGALVLCKHCLADASWHPRPSSVWIAFETPRWSAVYRTGGTAFIRIANAVAAALLELRARGRAHPRGTFERWSVALMGRNGVSSRDETKVARPGTLWLSAAVLVT
jgi:hypothetical protein